MHMANSQKSTANTMTTSVTMFPFMVRGGTDPDAMRNRVDFACHFVSLR